MHAINAGTSVTRLGDGAHVLCRILVQLVLERVPDMHGAQLGGM